MGKNPYMERRPIHYIVCPGCGKGHLVNRKGKYGHFWGCNRFPHCKWSCNLSEVDLATDKYTPSIKYHNADHWERSGHDGWDDFGCGIYGDI